MFQRALHGVLSLERGLGLLFLGRQLLAAGRLSGAHFASSERITDDGHWGVEAPDVTVCVIELLRTFW